MAAAASLRRVPPEAACSAPAPGGAVTVTPSRSAAPAASRRIIIRIDLASGVRIGPGKVALLEAIARTGSISGAGRALRMSVPAGLGAGGGPQPACRPAGGQRRPPAGPVAAARG